jgi:hypothetical protein
VPEPSGESSGVVFRLAVGFPSSTGGLDDSSSVQLGRSFYYGLSICVSVAHCEILRLLRFGLSLPLVLIMFALVLFFVDDGIFLARSIRLIL